jgi:hypothetical protein
MLGLHLLEALQDLHRYRPEIFDLIAPISGFLGNGKIDLLGFLGFLAGHIAKFEGEPVERRTQPVHSVAKTVAPAGERKKGFPRSEDL